MAHWSAEENGNYCNSKLSGWVLRYDPAPGGKRNDDGTTSYSLTFPALVLTDLVSSPEATARELTTVLESHGDLVAALKTAETFMAGFEGDEAQDGIDEKLVAIRVALSKAGEQ